jgi:hypothetical protein
MQFDGAVGFPRDDPGALVTVMALVDLRNLIFRYALDKQKAPPSPGRTVASNKR